MHGFQNQNSAQTLSQGVAEYFAVNPGLAVEGRDFSVEAQEFFRCHDIAHVVFGCDVSLNDELVVKMASIFGTTAGFGVLRGYRLHESRQIYRRLNASDMARAAVSALAIVPRTIFRCSRQRSRWPWAEHQIRMQTSLSELRQEFGIKVSHWRTGNKG